MKTYLTLITLIVKWLEREIEGKPAKNKAVFWALIEKQFLKELEFIRAQKAFNLELAKQETTGTKPTEV